MTFAPIVLFVYNRPWHTRQMVEALLKNQQAAESDLFIYADAAKNASSEEAVRQVREYIRTIEGFRSINLVERESNRGLARSIIAGVTEVVNRYGQVIVMEDDLVCSPFFLQYMNEALQLYQDQSEVISIHGYIYPVKQTLPETFFIRGADCWGWATWKRGWDLFEEDGSKLLKSIQAKSLQDEFDFHNAHPYTQMLIDQIEGRNDSWAIRWYASAFLNNKLTLYPGLSLIQNIGIDNSGTHSGKSQVFDVLLNKNPIHLGDIPIVEDKSARKIIEQYLKNTRMTLSKRVLSKLKEIF